MSGIYTNGITVATGALTGNEQGAFDTNLGQGQTPETEAISVFQLKGYYRPTVALTFASTISTNALLGEVFQTTLTGNTTLANPTNLQSGQTIKWELVQDATGSRTVAYGTAFKFSGSSAVSTSASAIDLVSATYDGTVLLTTVSTYFH